LGRSDGPDLLNGRVALVTGASGGLGAAIALGLARAGADVACHYGRDAAAATAVADEIRALGRAASVHAADVRRGPEVDALVHAVVTDHGRLDVLVNNAGVMNTTNFVALSEAEWDEVLDTNLKGYFLVGRAAAQEMVTRGYGRIVNVSSTRQEQAWPGSAAYASAKGGIWMLTRVMALELAPLGIRVNSVAPGTIETDLNRSYLSDPEFRRRRIEMIPVGRLGVPEDVVDAVVLLASERADFINGASLMIDGGQTLW
jgi:NAD(P)-dependent dehydrogenase (short-subunit alcohol dehydrogenase family)